MAFPTGWHRKCKLEIQYSLVPATVSNLLVLLTKDNLPSEIFDADGSFPAQNGGGDIRVTSDEAGTNLLGIHIRQFVTDNNPANGVSEIIVCVPSVSHTANTPIYIWYHTIGTESQPSPSSPGGSDSAYPDMDSAYTLGELSGSSCPDVTVNTRDGTYNGTLPNQITGVVGKGQEFNGTSDQVDLSTGIGPDQRAFQVMFFMYVDTLPGAYKKIFSTDGPWSSTYPGNLHIQLTSGDKIRLSVRDNVPEYLDSISSITADTWIHVICVVNNSAHEYRIYFNGVSNASVTTTTEQTVQLTDASTMGAWWDGDSLEGIFAGLLDEFISSNAVRGADWNLAYYRAMSAPNTFIIEGSPYSAGITPNGIASAESWGSPTIIFDQVITPNSISSSETWGNLRINLQVWVGSINGAEAFGTPSLGYHIHPNGIISEESWGNPDLDLIIFISSIPSSETFGNPNIIQMINANSIPSSEIFGIPTIKYEQWISANSIQSGEQWGSCELMMFIPLMSILSAETWGNPQISRGNVNVSPIGIISGESFGEPSISTGNIFISPNSILSEESFGNISIGMEIRPYFIDSSLAFGLLTITTGNINVIPQSIGSSEVFGTPEIHAGSAYITPIGISSQEQFGSPEIEPGNVLIVPNGIVSSESFGVPSVIVGSAYINPGGIFSQEAFGNPVILTGNVNVSPLGIVSKEAFGSLYLTVSGVQVSPFSISSSEDFGDLNIDVGSVSIIPHSINSEESFGNPIIIPGSIDITPSGIISQESFGTINIGLSIETYSIISGETFGSPSLSVGSVNIVPIGIITSESFGNPIVRNVLIINFSGNGIISSEIFGLPYIIQEVLNEFMQLMETDLQEGFFNEKEFAIYGTYIYKNGISFRLPIIYDNEMVTIDPDTGAEVLSRQPMIQAQTRDFINKPDKGDKIIIGGIRYQIIDHIPDGTGVSIFRLHHEKAV